MIRGDLDHGSPLRSRKEWMVVIYKRSQPMVTRVRGESRICSMFMLIGLSIVACPTLSPAQGDSADSASGSIKNGPINDLPYTPSLDLSALDRTADPCENFYQYSCGGWMAQNPIPADQSSWSVYSKLGHETNRYLWGLLQRLAAEAKPAKAGDQLKPTPAAKLGQYFGACMAEDAVEARGITPLRPNWQAIDAWKYKQQLAPLVAELHLMGGFDGPFFSFGATQDFADAERVIAGADAGGLGLPDRDYYLNTDESSKAMLQAYKQHIVKSLQIAGLQPKRAAQAAADVVVIETALAKASLTQVERRDFHNLDHKFDLNGLQGLTPEFSWPKYFKALNLAAPAVINVSEPEFYKAFSQQIRVRSLAEIKSYLYWHLVRAQSPYLNQVLVDEHFSFYGKKLQGAQELAPRWQRCVELVNGQLGEALGQEFVRRNFAPELKEQTLRITSQIEKAMREDIQSLSWMSAETKKQALAKLATVANKVGYPDRWRDYSNYSVDPVDFFGNVKRGNIFEVQRRFAKIGRPIDRGEWAMTPQTVNAYYDPQLNDINFPAAVLQPPLFDAKMDAAPNYGNTGGTIGHELTHGFDDSGRQFDERGNLRDWWTDADSKEFNQRTQCLVDQYGKYVVIDDIKINSRLTLGEDVADLGGMILAYAAWQAELGENKPEARDGFTGEQRFFIGFAQWACENVRPEARRVRALTDQHSPGKYRINGVAVNLPEFAKAFSCKANQAMVKEQPCRVW